MLGNAAPGDPARTVVKSLLYVCPVVPSTTGNGLTMRAGMVLEALADTYRVSLLAVPIYGMVDLPLARRFREKCANVVTIPYHTDGPKRIQECAEAYRGVSFDIIHAFRLSTVPFVRPYFKNGDPRPRRHLDLDDIESKTHRRIAALCRSTGNTVTAEEEETQSKHAQLLEYAAFRTFDRIYVCSEGDREELSARSKAEVLVLRNAVLLPEPVAPAGTDGLFRFLFLGTLGYYPNEDAVRFLHRSGAVDPGENKYRVRGRHRRRRRAGKPAAAGGEWCESDRSRPGRAAVLPAQSRDDRTHSCGGWDTDQDPRGVQLPAAGDFDVDRRRRAGGDCGHSLVGRRFSRRFCRSLRSGDVGCGSRAVVGGECKRVAAAGLYDRLPEDGRCSSMTSAA